MTNVRIAHAEPRPGRLPDGTFAVARILVVLADDPRRRALPVWLTVPDGDSLWRFLDRPPPASDETPEAAGIPEETADRLLRAAGATVAAVEIDVTEPDAGEPDPLGKSARIELVGPAGARQVTALPGYALALAAVAGAPVRVAGAVLDRLSRPADGADLAAQFLPPASARPPSLRDGRRWRFEPRNLSFSGGLDRWDLDGSFRRLGGASQQPAYAARAQNGSAVLSSAVPRPRGSGCLQQTIFADDYRGAAVTFRAQLLAEGVAGRAGLFLRIHAGGVLQPPDRDPEYRSPDVAGSMDWAMREVTANIPDDANFIIFGAFLTGPGRVRLRDTELARGA